MATRKKKRGRRKPRAKFSVVDLKRSGTSVTKLKKGLKKLKPNMLLIVRNAPFKLCTAERPPRPVALPLRAR